MATIYKSAFCLVNLPIKCLEIGYIKSLQNIIYIYIYTVSNDNIFLHLQLIISVLTNKNKSIQDCIKNDEIEKHNESDSLYITNGLLDAFQFWMVY